MKLWGLRKTVAWIGVGAWMAGCGYHMAGHYNTLPKSIRVIAVPTLEN